VGENTSRVIDVRVVAATNRPLAEAVRQSLFRADLLFRLAVVRLPVPPLRDRVEDIPLLAHAFWRSLLGQAGKRAVLGPDAIAQLCRHDWPGNVRELQNAIAALVVAAPERGRVGARHVGHVLAATSEAGPHLALPLQRARANVERSAVAGALARNGGRRTQAARELGMTRQGLIKAMKRLGLSDEWRTGVA
jgi:DNA-binding NtrC family response regulator